MIDLALRFFDALLECGDLGPVGPNLGFESGNHAARLRIDRALDIGDLTPQGDHGRVVRTEPRHGRLQLSGKLVLLRAQGHDTWGDRRLRPGGAASARRVESRLRIGELAAGLRQIGAETADLFGGEACQDALGQPLAGAITGDPILVRRDAAAQVGDARFQPLVRAAHRLGFHRDLVGDVELGQRVRAIGCEMRAFRRERDFHEFARF